MPRNNADFDEGKDHILTWNTASGDTVEQRFPSLAPGVNKSKAVGKYIAAVHGNTDAKPVKGSVKWKDAE
jgi:hypothetical protein